MITHFRLTQFAVFQLIMIIACITIAAGVSQKKIFRKTVKYVYRTIVSTLQIFARAEEHT